jgi:hypothetical protein
MHVPRNFTSEMSPLVDYTILRTGDLWPEIETDREKVRLAREGKFSLFVTGRIMYRDIFGDDWILGINRYWSPWSRLDKNATGGMWAPTVSGWDDTLRKIERSKPESEYPQSQSHPPEPPKTN